MFDLSCPADYMVTQMDYAGVKSIVLQNDHIYGNLGSYFAEAMRKHPGRFIGLANVDEAFAYTDEQMAILGRQRVSQERVDELREKLGLNDPIYVQYGR